MDKDSSKEECHPGRRPRRREHNMSSDEYKDKDDAGAPSSLINKHSDENEGGEMDPRRRDPPRMWPDPSSPRRRSRRP